MYAIHKLSGINSWGLHQNMVYSLEEQCSHTDRHAMQLNLLVLI